MYILVYNLGGGFEYFFMFTPKPWGNDPILTYAYFSNGCFNHHLAPLRKHDSIPKMICNKSVGWEFFQPTSAVALNSSLGPRFSEGTGGTFKATASEG